MRIVRVVMFFPFYSFSHIRARKAIYHRFGCDFVIAKDWSNRIISRQIESRQVFEGARLALALVDFTTIVFQIRATPRVAPTAQ